MKLDRNIERIVIFCKKIEKVSLLEHFLNITREVIKNVGIQEEHLRWSQKNNSLFAELSGVYIFAFEKHGDDIEVHFFINLDKGQNLKGDKDELNPFKFDNEKGILVRKINKTEDISNQLIEAHIEALNDYYETVKNSQLHKIRKGSGTTINQLFATIDKYDSLDSMVKEISAHSHDIKPIENKEGLIENLRNFKEYRESSNVEEQKFYAKRVQNGSSYVVYLVDGKLEFAPSRTVGYKRLNRLRYEPYINQEIDGRVTNQILEEIIGKRTKSKKFDAALIRYLNNIGITKKVKDRNKQLQYFMNDDLKKELDPYVNDLLNSTEPKSINNEEIDMKNMPLNQILYGPPGTGKTYKLKNEYFDRFTTRESNITAEQHFVSQAQDLSWWQAIALALLELGEGKVRVIQENRWVVHKAQSSNSKDENATVWNTLQIHSLLESKNVNVSNKQTPNIFEKNQGAIWTIDQAEVENQAPELFDILESVNNFKPNPEKLINRYVFTTFHQSFSYEDFIEGIKPVLDDESGDNLEYEIQDGVFKKICKRAEKDLENDYAIFIDEINRGNVASIFGELITLIEKDKRAGEEEALEVTLPYSKQKFSVPNNLYIIGTMNTADRSVEALDSALRRRFSFEEMMPKPELLADISWNEISMAEVLETINKRIEVLIDRDHTIGHSYFLGLKNKSNNEFELELRSIFKDKVIPLLQEYFFNDYGKIQLVLGKGFIQLESNQISNFATNDTEIDIGDYEDKKLYRILNPSNIEDALKMLLNQETEE